MKRLLLSNAWLLDDELEKPYLGNTLGSPGINATCARALLSSRRDGSRRPAADPHRQSCRGSLQGCSRMHPFIPVRDRAPRVCTLSYRFVIGQWNTLRSTIAQCEIFFFSCKRCKKKQTCEISLSRNWRFLFIELLQRGIFLITRFLNNNLQYIL